jgi:putative ATP-dependent endonuclease of the OLD family
MILKRVRVKNFRVVRDAAVEFGRHTAILGGNGTGKSTIIRAIDRFYASSTSVELDDFFGRRTDNPIEIALTFTSFSEDERNRFGGRIQHDEMTVVRVFEAAGSRNNGRYYGSTLQHPAFSDIRSASGANDKRRLFKDLRDNFPTYGLKAAQKAEDIEPQLLAWERDHADQCEMMRDNGQFFGFTNVFRGNLQKSTSFVFIPAVRDASADALVTWN